MSKIQVEILGISASPSAGGAYALLLKESYGSRRLPIIIGAYEAQAIALEMEGIKPPRPLTHDLLKNVVENLGAAVQEVYINELRENTFFAKIILEISAFTNEVDARPSDAIALAVRTNAPIFVSDEVMNLAAFISNEEESDQGDTEDEDTLSMDTEEKRSHAGPKEARIAALQNQLREALDREDYEYAARLRDELRKLSDSN